MNLVFVGSPLLDISVNCDKSTLKRFGLKDDDGIKACEKHNILFQELANDSNSELSSGGSAQNSARIAKWIAGPKAEVSFIGCTGNDPFDKWLREKLTADGVRPLYIQNPHLKTGICACLIHGEERSMITRHEAAATLSVQHLTSEPIQTNLTRANYVYVEGYVIAHSPDVVKALSHKYAPSQVFCLSLSAEYICKDYTDILLQVLPHVDILFGNEAEFTAFAAALGAPPEITVKEAIFRVRQIKQEKSKTSMITIVTSGAKPIHVVDRSNNLLEFKVPGNISMVDSVGCGDALAGAFLSAYALTNNLAVSIETGIRAATEIAQVKACNLPTFKIFDPETAVNSVKY